MIVKDLSNSFNPCPKNGFIPKARLKDTEKIVKKKQSKKTNKTHQKKNKNKHEEAGIIVDFCIMPKSTKYSTKRTKKYCERHEVFFGRAYRNKSIKDGLIVFLTEEDHRGKEGVHGKNGYKFNKYLKKIAQKAWMDYYKKTKEEFIEMYGQNFL